MLLVLAAVSAVLFLERAANTKGLMLSSAESLSSLSGSGAGILNEKTEEKSRWCALLLFFFFFSFVLSVQRLASIFITRTLARHLSLSLAIFWRPDFSGYAIPCS